VGGECIAACFCVFFNAILYVSYKKQEIDKKITIYLYFIF